MKYTLNRLNRDLIWWNRIPFQVPNQRPLPSKFNLASTSGRRLFAGRRSSRRGLFAGRRLFADLQCSLPSPVAVFPLPSPTVRDLHRRFCFPVSQSESVTATLPSADAARSPKLRSDFSFQISPSRSPKLRSGVSASRFLLPDFSFQTSTLGFQCSVGLLIDCWIDCWMLNLLSFQISLLISWKCSWIAELISWKCSFVSCFYF